MGEEINIREIWEADRQAQKEREAVEQLERELSKKKGRKIKLIISPKKIEKKVRR